MSPLSLLLFVDDHPWLRWSINATLLGLLAWLAVRPAYTTERKAQSWLFLLLMGLSLFCLRYPFLFEPRYIEIDEAQMLSQAITFQAHPIPWVDVDGTTSGPVNSYVLLWCVPFGIHPSYFTTRLFGLFCVAGMLSFLYLACQRVAGTLIARLSILPTFLFYGLVTHYEWVHYTSEHFSLFLLAWCVYLLVKLRIDPSSLLSAGLLGLLLGIAPFSKFQSTLPAAFLGLVGLGFLLWHGRFQSRGKKALSVLVLIGCAALPGTTLLSIVARAGGIYDFVQSYLRLGTLAVVAHAGAVPGFGQSSVRFGGILSRGTRDHPALPELLRILFFDAKLELAYLIYPALIVVAGLFLVLLAGKLPASRVSWEWLGTTMLFALVTGITAMVPGFPWVHYALYVTLALPLLTAACLRIVRTALRIRPEIGLSNLRGVSWFLFALMFCLLVPFLIELMFRISFGHQITLAQTQAAPMTYLRLVFLAVLVFVSQIISRAPGFSSATRTGLLQKSMMIGYMIVFLFVPGAILAAYPNPYAGEVRTLLTEAPQPIDQIVLRVLPPGGRLAVWGYEPDIAAETLSVQGTRDSITQFEILSTSLQDYYRARYMRDLRANRPEIFLEAVAADNFAYHDPEKYGIQIFPELAQYIADHYKLYETLDGMRLFIRSDLPTPP